jgi:hypothetical protein
MYDSDLVDYAMDSTKEFYRKETFEADLKLSSIVEESGGKPSRERMYKHVSDQLVFAFLHGASYAVEHELTSTAPSEETFSEFHKNVDFAVLFDFSDNDFGLAMEAAAKAYCDEFNGILRQIDMYDDVDLMKNSYLKEFEEICKIDSIKEIMKCGFLAQQMKHCAEVVCGRMPEAVAALESIKRDLDYIPWDKDMGRWEKVGDEYVETEKFPRFITGTNAEIAEDLKKYGDPFEDQTREFPVWCNGEVVILYMKNGYLTYLTR